MLLWSCKGQELPVFAYVSIMKQPILLKSRECVRPYCLIRERNGIGVLESSVISRHMFPRGSETSLSPLAQDWILISLKRRPTRFNSKRHEFRLRSPSPYSTQGPTPLLFLMEFNPQQSFYIMVIRSSSFQGPLKCANIKPFSCIIVDESPSNRNDFGYHSLTVRA